MREPVWFCGVCACARASMRACRRACACVRWFSAPDPLVGAELVHKVAEFHVLLLQLAHDTGEGGVVLRVSDDRWHLLRLQLRDKPAMTNVW